MCYYLQIICILHAGMYVICYLQMPETLNHSSWKYTCTIMPYFPITYILETKH